MTIEYTSTLHLILVPFVSLHTVIFVIYHSGIKSNFDQQFLTMMVAILDLVVYADLITNNDIITEFSDHWNQ